MTVPIESILKHLRILVASDTTNPPRTITPNHPALVHICGTLADAGFTVKANHLGDGCVNLLGVRGEPDLLFNCHLDTVPPDSGWSRDPLSLRIENDRAVGLGACDIKGAAACLIAAAEATDGDAAILFTTDEEAGDSRCVRTFCETHADDFSAVIVAEPTGSRAVTAHRGLLSVEGVFTGAGGHASSQGPRSALHDLARWANAALADPTFADQRFNIGRIEGGEKANMIASQALVRFGLRPSPGADPNELLSAIKSHTPIDAEVLWSVRFDGPALTPTQDSIALSHVLGLTSGDPVDFWAEAALFAQHGLPSLVFGPGDIAQAHAPDEHVTLDQLKQAASVYATVFAGSLKAPSA